MKKRLLILGVLLWSFILTGCSSNLTGDNKSTLTTEEKIEDFEQMYSEVEKGYPFLEVNKRLNDIDFLAEKNKFKEMITKTSSDDEFIYTLNLILRELVNKHNGVLNSKSSFDFFRELYKNSGILYFPVFDDEDVIKRYNSMESANDKSSKISASNYKDIEMFDVDEKEIAYIKIHQMNSANESVKDDMARIEKYLKNRQNYKALIIDIRGNRGGNDSYWTNLVSVITDKDYKMGGYNLFRSDSKAVNDYLNLKGEELHNINELPKTVVEKAPPETTKLFDKFTYNEDEITGDSKYPFKGNIYLLTDSKVFSSAESFAIFCKEKNFATVVGCKTAGDGGGVDPLFFKLDNSGLLVRMSSDMYLTESGICDEEEKVTPDIFIDDSPEFGRVTPLDTYINKIREIENIK